ncbi:hypothetical protein BDF20DRAFT_810281, partial [Mycotypha africana]|uniref:uncharacterized protein n=1 Tax=Mycotypha africana TaxID=64632 RepID=UPI002301497D
QEMQRPLSIRDKPGYIYAYQLNEGRLSGVKNFAYLKIGRTTDPHRRMYQIANTCDLVPKIIELFPSFPKSNGPMMPNNLEALEEEV